MQMKRNIFDDDDDNQALFDKKIIKRQKIAIDIVNYIIFSENMIRFDNVMFDNFLKLSRIMIVVVVVSTSFVNSRVQRLKEKIREIKINTKQLIIQRNQILKMFRDIFNFKNTRFDVEIREKQNYNIM